MYTIINSGSIKKLFDDIHFTNALPNLLLGPYFVINTLSSHFFKVFISATVMFSSSTRKNKLINK